MDDCKGGSNQSSSYVLLVLDQPIQSLSLFEPKRSIRVLVRRKEGTVHPATPTLVTGDSNGDSSRYCVLNGTAKILRLPPPEYYGLYTSPL